MEIDKWLDTNNFQQLNRQLIVEITPLAPFSLCRNKGNCYAFNIIPSKQALCGLFQNFLNIRYNRSQLPTKFQKVSSYQLNNNLAFCPIIDNHFIIEGIKYPKIDAIYINYESTLNVSEETNDYQTAPTKREYGVTSDSYILKLRCSELFYNEMLQDDNSFSNLFLGNKQSFCSISFLNTTDGIKLEPYEEDIKYETFSDCIANYQTMDLWAKYGFTYLLNRIFPDYINNPSIINGVKIYDKIDEIKNVLIEEKQFSSFTETTYDETNMIQNFQLKAYETDKDKLNNHIALKYSTAKGDTTKNFRNEVLNQITSNNDGFSFLNGLDSKGKKIQGCMWVNPFFLSKDRIANNKAKHNLPNEVILFSILTTLTYDKFYKYDEGDIYTFIPELDFINMIKYHKYITSNLKNRVGRLLSNKRADLNKTSYPKLFFGNVENFINLKSDSHKVKDVVDIVNLNHYIADILNESQFSFDDEFIDCLSNTYWSLISPQKKLKLCINPIIQETILKNYSKGNKCLENFKIKYDSSNLLIYTFSELLCKPTLYNAYRFYVVYNKQNDKMLKYNILINNIIKNIEMNEKVKNNSMLLGELLNKKAFLIAKNKCEKNNKSDVNEEKIKYIKNIANIVNRGKNLSEIIYLLNNYFLRFNIVNNVIGKLDADFLTNNYNENDFLTIKRLIYISLTSEKFVSDTENDNNDEIESEEIIDTNNIFND